MVRGSSMAARVALLLALGPATASAQYASLGGGLVSGPTAGGVQQPRFVDAMGRVLNVIPGDTVWSGCWDVSTAPETKVGALLPQDWQYQSGWLIAAPASGDTTTPPLVLQQAASLIAVYSAGCDDASAPLSTTTGLGALGLTTLPENRSASVRADGAVFLPMLGGLLQIDAAGIAAPQVHLTPAALAALLGPTTGEDRVLTGGLTPSGDWVGVVRRTPLTSANEPIEGWMVVLEAGVPRVLGRVPFPHVAAGEDLTVNYDADTEAMVYARGPLLTFAPLATGSLVDLTAEPTLPWMTLEGAIQPELGGVVEPGRFVPAASGTLTMHADPGLFHQVTFDPALLDADNDGLDGAYELTAGLAPWRRDTDGDGFGDGWDDAPTTPVTLTRPRRAWSTSTTIMTWGMFFSRLDEERPYTRQVTSYDPLTSQDVACVRGCGGSGTCEDPICQVTPAAPPFQEPGPYAALSLAPDNSHYLAINETIERVDLPSGTRSAVTLQGLGAPIEARGAVIGTDGRVSLLQTTSTGWLQLSTFSEGGAPTVHLDTTERCPLPAFERAADDCPAWTRATRGAQLVGRRRGGNALYAMTGSAYGSSVALVELAPSGPTLLAYFPEAELPGPALRRVTELDDGTWLALWEGTAADSAPNLFHTDAAFGQAERLWSPTLIGVGFGDDLLTHNRPVYFRDKEQGDGGGASGGCGGFGGTVTCNFPGGPNDPTPATVVVGVDSTTYAPLGADPGLEPGDILASAQIYRFSLSLPVGLWRFDARGGFAPFASFDQLAALADDDAAQALLDAPWDAVSALSSIAVSPLLDRACLADAANRRLFELDLEAGRPAALRLVQRDADVRLCAYDPEGELVTVACPGGACAVTAGGASAPLAGGDPRHLVRVVDTWIVADAIEGAACLDGSLQSRGTGPAVLAVGDVPGTSHVAYVREDGLARFGPVTDFCANAPAGSLGGDVWNIASVSTAMSDLYPIGMTRSSLVVDHDGLLLLAPTDGCRGANAQPNEEGGYPVRAMCLDGAGMAAPYFTPFWMIPTWSPVSCGGDPGVPAAWRTSDAVIWPAIHFDGGALFALTRVPGDATSLRVLSPRPALQDEACEEPPPPPVDPPGDSASAGDDDGCGCDVPGKKPAGAPLWIGALTVAAATLRLARRSRPQPLRGARSHCTG